MTLSNGHFIHTTIDGDRWDLLAYRYYGDANKQGVIIEANRDQFIDPLVVPPLILPSGMKLIVPVVEVATITDDDLPPWKRDVATYGGAV